MINANEVVRTHTQEFYGALKAQDFAALSNLYAEDYMLVRPDGSVLSKQDVLRDLQAGGLMFTSIEIANVSVRIYGQTALLPHGDFPQWRNGTRPRAAPRGVRG